MVGFGAGVVAAAGVAPDAVRLRPAAVNLEEGAKKRGVRFFEERPDKDFHVHRGHPGAARAVDGEGDRGDSGRGAPAATGGDAGVTAAGLGGGAGAATAARP